LIFGSEGIDSCLIFGSEEIDSCLIFGSEGINSYLIFGSVVHFPFTNICFGEVGEI
jgi:hypothetical protein